MRIAIDATALGSGKGGDATYARGLLAGLALAAPSDARFLVFLNAGGAPPPGIARDGRFELRQVASSNPAGRYLIEFPRVLARERPRMDLLHTQIHAPLGSEPPVVLLVPDLSFRHFPEQYRLATRLRLNLLIPLHIRRARLVATVSEFSRQDLIATYGLSGDRVVVIPNAVATPPLPSDEEEAAMAALRLRGAVEPFFLYVGNLHPRKNLVRLIAAFERARRSGSGLSAQRLVIAGASWRWGADVAATDDRATVRLGSVTELERVALMRRATALAYPSLFEGFGLPPLEALALGTPVLASNTSSMPEVLGDAALLIDPYDVDAMAEGLVRLSSDQALVDRLRPAGLARAARFGPERTGRAAIAAFTKAIGLSSTVSSVAVV